MKVLKFVLVTLILLMPILALANDKAPKVAFIVVNDKIESPYNQGIYSGLQQALKKGKISNLTYYVPKSHDECKPKAEELISEGYDIIVMYSIFVHDVGLQLAAKYPNVKFLVMDAAYDFDDEELPSNLYSMSFDEFAGGFLVGAFVGMMSGEYSYSLENLNPDKKVGILKGPSSSGMDLIEDGFRSGVAYVCDDCEIISESLGSFTDKVGAYRSATRIYENNVDIIFPIVGSSVGEVMRAASENKKFMIGIDTDMFKISDRVLVSATKDISFAVEKTLENVVKADVNDKVSKRNFIFGFGNKGIQFSSFHSYDSKIPQAVKNRLEKIIKDIDSGNITTNN